jgi:hypothetical protein
MFFMITGNRKNICSSGFLFVEIIVAVINLVLKSKREFLLGFSSYFSLIKILFVLSLIFYSLWPLLEIL